MSALGQWVVIAHRYDRNPPMELYGPYGPRAEAATAAVMIQSREEYESAFALQLTPRFTRETGWT